MIRAELVGSTMRVRFPYDRATVLKMHQILDSRWNKAGKFWYVPISPWHAEQLLSMFPEIEADPWIKHIARTMPVFRRMSATKTHPHPQGGLYPYQMAGVDFIEACNGRALVADSTGTGKTVTVLHWAALKGDKVKTILVVCPSSVKYKWSQEIKTWYDPDANPYVVDSPYLPQSNILIMSYDRMRTLSQQLYSRDYDLIILDEIQAIKNPKSKRGTAARRIASKSTYVLGISATPTPNRPMELFNELHTIRPWEYVNSWDFGSRYAGGPYGHSAFKGNSNVEELRDRLTSIMIRRKKAEVLEQLPELTRSTMWADLPREQHDFYDDVESSVKEALRSMNPKHKGYYAGVLDKITALREAVGIAKAKGLASDFINDFLEEGDSKMVVSCFFKTTITSLQEGINEFPLVMTGDTTDKAREDMKNLFRFPGGPRVLIMSAVGSEGIDLFGMNGVDISNILILDRQWTASGEEQAEGRLHRIGQLNAVTAHYINANGTIDMFMDEIVESKRKLGEQTVNQGEIVNLIVRRLLGHDNNT